LRLKRWQCRMIYKEDSVEETLNHIDEIIIQQETAKVHMPKGPEPTHKKLIKLLKQTDEALISEEKRRCRRRSIIWGLKDRRKNIERRLHTLIKPAILERDSNRCRACGSVENLELARLSGRDMAKPEQITRKRTVWHYPDAEKRWAEENMLMLCGDCHKIFDSLNAIFWRRDLGNLSIDQALELLQSGRLKQRPPCFERYALATRCSGVKTFFKVLRKAIIFHKKDNPKQARLYLGHVKKNWRFISKETFLPKELREKIENSLQEIYRLGSTVEMEKIEQEIRDNIMKPLEQNVPPEVFSKFKDALLKQDKVLLTI